MEHVSANDISTLGSGIICPHPGNFAIMRALPRTTWREMLTSCWDNLEADMRAREADVTAREAKASADLHEMDSLRAQIAQLKLDFEKASSIAVEAMAEANKEKHEADRLAAENLDLRQKLEILEDELQKVSMDALQFHEKSVGVTLNSKRNEALLQLLIDCTPCASLATLFYALEHGLQKVFMAQAVALHIVSGNSTMLVTCGGARLVMCEGMKGIIGLVAKTLNEDNLLSSQVEGTLHDPSVDLPAVAKQVIHTVPICAGSGCVAVCQFRCIERDKTMVTDDGTYDPDSIYHCHLLHLFFTFVQRHLDLVMPQKAQAIEEAPSAELPGDDEVLLSISQRDVPQQLVQAITQSSEVRRPYPFLFLQSAMPTCTMAPPQSSAFQLLPSGASQDDYEGMRATRLALCGLPAYKQPVMSLKGAAPALQSRRCNVIDRIAKKRMTSRPVLGHRQSKMINSSICN